MEDMEKVYKEHAKTVYKFLRAQNVNESLAEELTQETFLKAYKGIDSFNGNCKMSVWLCQIAKHLLYQHIRKSKKEIPKEETYGMTSDSCEEEFILKESTLSLFKGIHSLKDETKEVIYLRSLGNLSFKEIGDVMGKSENWARVTFYRGKEKLKGGMKDE